MRWSSFADSGKRTARWVESMPTYKGSRYHPRFLSAMQFFGLRGSDTSAQSFGPPSSPAPNWSSTVWKSVQWSLNSGMLSTIRLH
jgi:hypothetical protein